MEQKKIVAVFLPSLVISVFFVIMGSRVVSKYWSTRDWHFFAALAGIACFVSFISALLFAVLMKKRGGQKKAGNE